MMLFAIVSIKVLMFSATLHSPEITSIAEKICKFPTWVDLKGKESVPEVPSLVLPILPFTEKAHRNLRPCTMQ